MLNNEEFINLAKEIKSGFGFRRKILFIGSKFQRSQLPPKLCEQNWSAVITSSNDECLLELFSKPNRTVISVVKEGEKIVPNIDEMPVIFLHKIDESSEWYSEDSFTEILSEVMGRIRCGGYDVLYTVGLYDEFDIGKLCRRIPTYHMGQKDFDPKSLKNLKVYEEELAFFFENSDEDDEEFESMVTGPNVFYKNGKYVSISDEDMMNAREFLILATSKAVEQVSPVGDIQMALSFEKFLKDSPHKGPQWIGYLPETKFNVVRTFEEALVNVVSKALKGEMPNSKDKYDPAQPIVLMGPPASSKSVTLGSLAYRIFSEHNNPVIFIKNEEDFSKSYKFEALSNLMENVNNLPGDARILLIWDSSSIKDTLEMANNLANKLNNRGRKFVLVCSSYQYILSEDFSIDICFDNKTKKWTRYDKNKHENDPVYTRFRSSNDCLIIDSTRTVTQDEIESIKEKYKKYAGIDIGKENQTSRFGGANGNDIFMYFYNLVYFLRDPIEQGVKQEHINLAPTHDVQLRDIYKNKSGFRLGLFSAEFLKECGLSESDIGSDYPKERFKRFQECIALFSQFKIKTPRGFAMTVLDDNEPNVVYSTENNAIYKFVEDDIPWIYSATVNGDLVFGFRSAEEAALYLQEEFNGADGCKECMDLIISLFDTYMEYNEADQAVVKCFSGLLKELGPNREWQLYSGDVFLNEFSEYFKKHMEEVINKLEEILDLRINLDYMYSLTLNKLTLCREYYGDRALLASRLDDSESYDNSEKYEYICKEKEKKYKDNMDNLGKTIVYTRGRIDEIEALSYDSSCTYQRNQMITELANCNVALFDLQEDYLNYCEENGVEPDSNWKELHLKSNFSDLFNKLSEAIYSNPENGYLYNAIFKIYIKYKKVTSKVEYDILNRLNNIIENSLTVSNISNRGANGRDEMGKHIAEIEADMCGVNVTLDAVLKKSNDISGFLTYHEKMLDKGEASSICFIAYAELLQNKIIGQKQKDTLMDKELKVCENVRKYMMSDKIFAIVSRDQNALGILFRVCWICYMNADPYSDLDKECRTTNMTLQQWKVMYNICEDYINVCRNKGVDSSYFMNYIYALSTIEIALISGENITESFKKSENHIKKLQEKSFIGKKEKRMKTPFLICDEIGEEFTANFTIKDVKKDNTGTMTMTNPNNAEGINFRVRAENIGYRGKQLSAGIYIKNLSIGLSYTSFSVYKSNNSKGERTP